MPPAPLARRPKKKRFVLFAVCLLIALSALWTCGKDAYKDYRLASAAVDQFHQQLDRGDFETIYSEATDDFRRAGTRADEINFFEMVHQKMGNSGKMSAHGFHVNWQNGRQYVSQVCGTKFALGLAQESFIWRVDEGHAHLQAYRIDSANLH
jgi:hypothetical protein